MTSSRTIVLCCLLILATTAGCTTTAERRNRIIAGPTRGLPIKVVPFDASDMDSNINLGLTDFGDEARLGRTIAQRIVIVLRKRGAQATVDKTAEPAADFILVRGRVESVDKGNRAARVSTMGIAGGAKVSLTGTVVHGQEVLGEFTLSRKTHAGGLFGGDAEGRIDQCLDDLGADIAKMILRGNYRTEPE